MSKEKENFGKHEKALNSRNIELTHAPFYPSASPASWRSSANTEASSEIQQRASASCALHLSA